MLSLYSDIQDLEVAFKDTIKQQNQVFADFLYHIMQIFSKDNNCENKREGSYYIRTPSNNIDIILDGSELRIFVYSLEAWSV